MTDRSNPDTPARKRAPRKRAPRKRAEKAAAPAAPNQLEVLLQALRHASTPDAQRTTHTSLGLATARPVDTDHYSRSERAAATAAHAMDYGFGSNRNAMDALSFIDATSWPGFQTLGLLAQLPEYRNMHERLADEVVRTWGKVVSTSKDEGAADKITKLHQAFERLKVRSLIREAVIHDQAYGGAHIFPRLKDSGSDVPADAPLLLSPSFVKRDCLEALSCVEPLWVSPLTYNASDPTKANFYKPSSWMMLSTEVHASRLFTMISRPVSDLLKAAYSFRGVSITQLAMPSVDNWLRTRQSVSDTVKQFSITNLATDLAQLLTPGGAQSLDMRLQLFNANRDNRNVGAVDKETEEIQQVNTPLSGLDALQAQAQEQLSAISHQPLVVAFGITPAGLNANSDGEIRVWYDYVAGYQAHNPGPVMHWILQLVQLSEFGEIDEGLTWEWNPLYELTDVELADVRNKNADTARTYAEMGAISSRVVQETLAADPLSGYAGALADRTNEELDEELAQQMAQASATESENEGDPDGANADEPDA